MFDKLDPRNTGIVDAELLLDLVKGAVELCLGAAPPTPAFTSPRPSLDPFRLAVFVRHLIPLVNS